MKHISWRSLPNSTLLQIATVLLLFTGMFCWVLSLEYKTVGSLQFAMDDAWIHAAVAQNWLEGKGWGIVPNRTLSVSTSPTWTLSVALAALFSSDMIYAVLGISFIYMAITCVLLYLLIARLSGVGLFGVLGVLLFLLNPIVIWGMAAGMELPLVLLALLLVLYLYYEYDADSRVRLVAVPLSLAFAAVTRPEMFMLIPLALLDTGFSLYQKAVPAARRLACRTFIIQAAIVLAGLSPYFLFNYANIGHLFPTTYYAKTIVRGVGLSAALQDGSWNAIWDALITNGVTQFHEIYARLFSFNLPLLLLLVPGSIFLSQQHGSTGKARGILIVLALLVLPYAMGVTSPAKDLSNHGDRYYVIFPALYIILGCLGLQFLQLQLRSRLLVAALVSLIVLLPWRQRFGGHQSIVREAAKLLVKDVDSTKRLYQDMGIWLRDNLPPEARLAVNDIGGIAWYTRRDFIDVMGLSSPEIWPVLQRGYGAKLDQKRLRDYLKDQKVEYVVLCPKYYPQITGNKEVFEEVMRWTEKYDHGRLISPQVLYKVHWDRSDPPIK